MARKFLSNVDLKKYRDDAFSAYLAVTDAESALRLLDIEGDRRDLKLLVMSLRDLCEVLQIKLKDYISCL